MTRSWTRWAATLIDSIGAVWSALLVIGAGLLIGLAWHTYPAWIPRRGWLGALRGLRPHWSKWRLPWRRGAKKPTPSNAAAGNDATADDQLPDLASAILISHADALAAQGRFAEAVRERLRAIVRELVEAGVVAHYPAWTVTELSRAAGQARPSMAPPLDGASRIFSDIWYGERPAHADHDAQMRTHANDVHTLVAGEVAAR